MVRNRDTWTVTGIHGDGSLTATGAAGAVRLPRDYVAAHVELGYAQTSHATQGRTVDHAYLVLDTPTDTRGLYVPLTRGRRSNHAFIVTTGEDTPAELFTQALTRTWIDQPAVVHRQRLHDQRRPAHPGLSPVELRTLLDRQRQLVELRRRIHPLPHLAWDLQRLHDKRRDADRSLTAAQASLERSADTLRRYDKPLRRRRHSTTIANAKGVLRTTPDRIRWYENELARIDKQIADVADQVNRNRRDVDQLPRLDDDLDRIEQRLRRDRQDRAAALLRPQETVGAVLGPRPLDPAVGRDWDEAAGRVHQLDVAYGPTDPGTAVRRLEAQGHHATPQPSPHRPPARGLAPVRVEPEHDLGIDL